MAKSTSKSGKQGVFPSAPTGSGVSAGVPVGPPAGFRSMTAASAPWALKEVGAVVTGELLGRYEIDSGSAARGYYQVRVTQPCQATSGKGEDREVVEVHKGEIVNLNENHKIKQGGLPELADVVGRGGRVMVWVKFGEKIELRNGNSMWDAEVYSQIVEGPRFEKSIVAESATADDATPF